MAGFDHQLGRSNNMVLAEAAGKVTIGRWAKRHKVSARAAVEVMRPGEAHHTGTGHRGKSRLTPVIDSTVEPTSEQVTAMQAWDRGERPAVRGWYTVWGRVTGRYGRVYRVPRLATYEGDPVNAPRDFAPLEPEDFARAKLLAGRPLRPYAIRFDAVRDE